MALLEIEDPSPRALRWFGLPFAAVVGLVSLGLAFGDAGRTEAALGVAVAGAAILTLYYAIPAIRRGVYMTWMYAAFPLGLVMSHLIMALIYFVVITPIGLIARLTRPDPMARTFDPQAPSYWRPHRPRAGLDDYFRQF